MTKITEISQRHQQLIHYLDEVTDQAQLQARLALLLTPQELQDIANRLEIIRLLQQGMPQRMIAKALGVGIATVTRGARQLQSRSYQED